MPSTDLTAYRVHQSLRELDKKARDLDLQRQQLRSTLRSYVYARKPAKKKAFYHLVIESMRDLRIEADALVEGWTSQKSKHTTRCPTRAHLDMGLFNVHISCPRGFSSTKGTYCLVSVKLLDTDRYSASGKDYLTKGNEADQVKALILECANKIETKIISKGV